MDGFYLETQAIQKFMLFVYKARIMRSTPKTLSVRMTQINQMCCFRFEINPYNRYIIENKGANLSC